MKGSVLSWNYPKEVNLKNLTVEKQSFSAVVIAQCTEIQKILKDVVEQPSTGKSCLQNDNIEFVI